MKKLSLLSTLLAISIVSLFGNTQQVIAADTGVVAATVTVQNVSVTVSDGTVAYGTLALNTSAGTNGTDLQTATNNGNITEDFNIKGSNSTAWTLAGAAGANAYVHRFCIATCNSAPTNYTALTTSYQTLASGVAASGTQTFDLYVTTPTTSASYTEQSIDVTVQAVAP